MKLINEPLLSSMCEFAQLTSQRIPFSNHPDPQTYRSIDAYSDQHGQIIAKCIIVQESALPREHGRVSPRQYRLMRWVNLTKMAKLPPDFFSQHLTGLFICRNGLDDS